MSEFLTYLINIILSNKEWLFSGFGISATLGIIKFYSWYTNRKKDQSKSKPSPMNIHSEKTNISAIIDSGNSVKQSIEIINHSHNTLPNLDEFSQYPDYPTVFDLIQQFESLTPFQKIDYDYKINGTEFKAKGNFASISKGNDLYLIIFSVKNISSYGSILLCSEINIDSFPIFRSLYTNQECQFAGSVTKITTNQIYFNLQKVKILTKT